MLYSLQVKIHLLRNIYKLGGFVYNIIVKWQPISNERIAEHLGIYPHQVTPRVYELREMGLVEFAGESISELSKRKVSLWRVNPEGKQLSLFV